MARATVENYKSFRLSGELVFTPGFNVAVGPNNVGKTALLEALSLRFTNKPHRSRETMPTRESLPDPVSRVKASLVISREELWDGLQKLGDIRIPLPREGTYGLSNKQPEELIRYLDWILSQETFVLSVVVNGGDTWIAESYPTHGLYVAERVSGNQFDFAIFTRSGRHRERFHTRSAEQETNDSFLQVARELRDRIYRFYPERRIGACAVGPATKLNPSAENLAEVLNNLQGNPERFARFNRLVKQVFVQIQAISVISRPGNLVDILIWTDDPATERDDLAVPIAESGTGMGQVLAILYVVITSESPTIILIDELQTYLHPSAVRNLIEICKAFPQHQYIVATHSPTVITAAAPQKIYQLTLADRQSAVSVIDPQQTQQLRSYLGEIGASLADVFGSETVLWVEGATEETCFPVILQIVADTPLIGAAIVGLKHTGDLETRHAQLILELYEKLSMGSSLLPPAIGFIFDREGRSEEEMQNLRRGREDRVFFTALPMYENYLLYSAAIAGLLNSIPGSRDHPFTAEEVEIHKAELEGQAQFRIRVSGQERGTHGARLIAALFATLTETRVEYDKVTHGLALTTWLAQNAPNELREISDLLTRLVRRGSP